MISYDVQINDTVLRGISYAELVSLPIDPDTFVRRDNGDWIYAKDCIELTHILAYHPDPGPVNTSPPVQSHFYNYVKNEHDENEESETDDFNDDSIENEVDEAQQNVPRHTINPNPSVQPYYRHDEIDEERIFIPTAEYFKCRQKRKAAIIGVCTLGLAGLSLIGIGNTWRGNIFAGTSFSANAGIGFVLKCLSFFLLTALIAIPYFIYSVFALIYYSIRLNNLKRS